MAEWIITYHSDLIEDPLELFGVTRVHCNLRVKLINNYHKQF